MPPDERRLRAVFFDAGNTLLRMNYAVIAAELGRHGVRAAPDEVQRAEWRARGRPDGAVVPPARPRGFPGEPPSAPRVLRHLLVGRGGPGRGTVGQDGAWPRAVH